ncbi:MAG TPA: hypothetical protein VFQ22_02970 [Longimicrobiales bacterium]|nr:hypothetical protein [Longimicrobiales bacterium]
MSAPPPGHGPPLEPPPPPSRRKLLLATAGALVLAAVLLVTVVLPAEYDIDPLGTGRALGLVVLSGTAAEIPVRSDGLIPARSSWRTDSRTFTLAPGGWVEYKYRLEAGRAMLYSWTASGWVRSEMHSEPDGAPPGTAEFFEVAERTLFRHGSYVAPFPGIHGWYWLNEGPDSVTVELHAAGFFDTSFEFREDEAPLERAITATPDSAGYRPYF